MHLVKQTPTCTSAQKSFVQVRTNSISCLREFYINAAIVIFWKVILSSYIFLQYGTVYAVVECLSVCPSVCHKKCSGICFLKIFFSDFKKCVFTFLNGIFKKFLAKV